MAESYDPEDEWRIRERHEEILSTMKVESPKSADVSNDEQEGDSCSSLSQHIESENSEAVRSRGGTFKRTAQQQSNLHGKSRKYDLRPQRQKAIIEVSDGEDDLVFSECVKTTSARDALRQQKSCKTRAICIHCQRQYSTKRILFTHLISQHGEDAENAEKLVSAAKVVKFLTTENDDGRPYVCNLCSRSYGNPVKLQEHIRSHTSETSRCPVCNKVYSKGRDLQRHLQKHRHRTRFMCPDCPYNCLTDQVFWQHMIVEHKLTVQEAKSLAGSIKQNEGPDETNDSHQVSQGTEENNITKVRERPSKPVRKSRKKRQAAKPKRAPKDRVAVNVGQNFTGPEDGSTVTFVLDDLTAPGVSHSFHLDDIEDQQQNNYQIPLGVLEVEISCLSCNRTFQSARSLRRHICTIINKLNVESTSYEDRECQSDDTCTLVSKVPSQTRSRKTPIKQLLEKVQKYNGNRPAVPVDKSDIGGCAPGNSSCENSEGFPPLKRFNCKICLKMFPRSTSLAVHIIRAHDWKISRFLCTLCGRKFWKSDQLQVHVLKIHHVSPEVVAKFISKYPKETVKRAVRRHPSRPLATVRGSVKCVEPVETATNVEQPKKKRPSRCHNRRELAAAVSEQFSGHCALSTTQNSMESDLVACITHFTQAVQKIPELISGSLRGMQNVVPPSSMCSSSDTCQCGQVKKWS